MIMPDDKTITWVNCIGVTAVLLVVYLIATLLHAFSAGFIHISIACLLLFLASLLVIGRYARQTADNFTYQLYASRATWAAVAAIVVVTVYAAQLPAVAPQPVTITGPLSLFSTTPFKGHTPECQVSRSR